MYLISLFKMCGSSTLIETAVANNQPFIHWINQENTSICLIVIIHNIQICSMINTFNL